MRTFEMNSRNTPRQKVSMPKKPKRWSHQDDLDALKGQKLRVEFANGGSFEGKLLDADQFTLKMNVSSQAGVVVIFKSTLTYFAAA